MVPITVVRGHLLVSMHLSSQHLCKMELCYFPHFTDGELKHREILDSDTQLTVLNVLTMCQLSHSHRNHQDLHPCLAGNAKWLRLKRRRVTINVTLHHPLHGNPGYSTLSPIYDHYLPFMTITSHLWQLRSKPTTIAAQLRCGFLPCHPNSMFTCTESGAQQEIKPYLQCLKRGIPSTKISLSKFFFLPCQELHISWQIFPVTGYIFPSNLLTQELIAQWLQWFYFLFV